MSFLEDVSLSHKISTAEVFRAWVKRWHEAFEACGLAQTTDTGQINLATVEAPAAANTFMGYSIWKFNDAEASEKPVFIKFEWGSGASVAERPRIGALVGTGSNGSGTLTGSGTQKLMASTTNPTTEKGGIFANFIEGHFMMLQVNSVAGEPLANNPMFGCGRLRDPSTNAVKSAYLYSAFGFGTLGEAVEVFQGGSWKAGNAIKPSGSVAESGLVIPSFHQIISPVVAAQFPGFCLMASTALSKGDTGKILVGTKEREYKRIVSNGLGAGDVGGATLAQALLLLHE